MRLSIPLLRENKKLQVENKELMKRVTKLEHELARAEERASYVKKVNLPKCESTVCRSCAYAARVVGQFGEVIFLGCIKEHCCENYTPEAHSTLIER